MATPRRGYDDTVPAHVKLMGLLGAVKAKNPASYSQWAQIRLRYLVKHFMYVLNETETREAQGEEASMLRNDMIAAAVALRVLLRPEVAAIVEEEVARDN